MDEYTGRNSGHERSRSGLLLRYDRAADVRRDRLSEFPRGIMARTNVPLRAGDEIGVHIEVQEGPSRVSALGEVAWAKPIASGTLAGVSLSGESHRDDVKLDLLLGVRTSGTTHEELRSKATIRQALRVALLQPNPVLGNVIVSALERFAHEKSRGALLVETAANEKAFFDAVTARPPDLAIIDCDGIVGAAEPLLVAVRSGPGAGRVPIIILSDESSPRFHDRAIVTIRKPVWMRGLLDSVDLLLRH